MVLKQTHCLWTLHSMGLPYSAFPGASVSNIQTSQIDGFKTDTLSLDTTQHGTAIFSIPWCIGQQAFTELYTYFNTYEESDIAGNKEK